MSKAPDHMLPEPLLGPGHVAPPIGRIGLRWSLTAVNQADILCGFFFTTVVVFRTVFLLLLASDLSDSI
jgi:hypothetical protein